ncbi:ABC-three component system middle component 2 [Nocardia testacea]|uniref:ABC-three component system middle component 2 n=1 Tax=Nocardia testacea TaxID=248551 RepID=UPI0005846DB4|nr:ABC-three component system middle component 2 [Nocardia testacea]
MNPLNSAIETGVRVLMLLAAAFPERLDLNQLVLLDHGLLHSADLGGPPSLHPPILIRASGLGVRREAIEAGLDVLIRADLACAGLSADGIRYWAGERADGFIGLLGSTYASSLQERALWVIGRYEGLDEGALRREFDTAVSHWTEEFHYPAVSTDGMG